MFVLYELIDLLPTGFTPVFVPRLNKLYLFLAAQPPMTPQEATERYLGDIEKLAYFNKLRRELKTALTRYLIANPSWVDNKDKSLHEECYRNFASYKILLLSSKREAGIKLAERLLSELEKVELYTMMHSVANDLLLHYSSVDVKPKFVKKYAAQAQKYLAIVSIEAQVRQEYSRVVMYCNSKISFTPKVINEFIEATEKTWPLLQTEIHHINRLIYSIKVFRFMVIYDYENIIKYCNEALDNFPKDHPNIRSFSFFFMYHKVPALLALGQSTMAKQVAKKASKIVPVGYFNWHLILLKRIVVCLHTADYQEAYDLYRAHIQKDCSYPIIAEYWNIIRGYLYFLIKLDKIVPYTKERFYLGKFLNEMPIYSRDKSGNNINILIIQILINMQRERFAEIIDRVDSLREYVRIYMRNPETKRAKLFIDMIIKMESASFHRNGTERKTKKLYEKLKETPLKLKQNLAIEIIPYEVLWHEILILLDNKFRSSKNKTTKLQ